MNDLVLCTVCHRHVRSDDADCPFCRRPMPTGEVATIVGAAIVGAALTAGSPGCAYGPPYHGQGGEGGTATSSDTSSGEHDAGTD